MADLRIGVIGLPGKWSTEALADALETRCGYRRVIDMTDVHVDLAGGSLLHQGLDLGELDGLAVKKICQTYSANTLDRLEMLRMAEVRGVRVFSPALSMLRVVNRLSCTMTLSEHGIPMPDTVITQSRDVALDAVLRYERAVMKPLYSTKARGMRLLETQGQEETAIGAAVDAFAVDNPVMYVQQQVDLNGRDLGLVFVGGEYRGAYARVAQDDAWTTVIHRGGRYVHADPGQELIELARRAQAPFGLDFTTVDVAETPEGPIIFEVSAFGGFRGALDGGGFNAAEAYADYIVESLGQWVGP